MSVNPLREKPLSIEKRYFTSALSCLLYASLTFWRLLRHTNHGDVAVAAAIRDVTGAPGLSTTPSLLRIVNKRSLITLPYRSREFTVGLPTGCILLLDYLAWTRLPQSATQIANAMAADPFITYHARFARAAKPRRRCLSPSRFVVKASIGRIRSALSATFAEAGLALAPSAVLTSDTTTSNQVLNRASILFTIAIRSAWLPDYRHWGTERTSQDFGSLHGAGSMPALRGHAGCRVGVKDQEVELFALRHYDGISRRHGYVTCSGPS